MDDPSQAHCPRPRGAAAPHGRRPQAQLVQAGKLSAAGQLVSGVAHELNNPLSVVIGYGQLLAERALSAEIRRPVELIVAQGGRMAKIVQSLLLFSRQREAERAAVDAREAIERTLGRRASQLVIPSASARRNAWNAATRGSW